MLPAQTYKSIQKLLTSSDIKKSSTRDVTLCKKDEYNHYLHAHVVFYSESPSGDYEFLLFKEDEHYHEIRGDYESVDSTIIFTAARAIVTHLYGIFTKLNIQKLCDG